MDFCLCEVFYLLFSCLFFTLSRVYFALAACCTRELLFLDFSRVASRNSFLHFFSLSSGRLGWSLIPNLYASFLSSIPTFSSIRNGRRYLSFGNGRPRRLISVNTLSAWSTFPTRLSARIISPYVSGAGTKPFSCISRSSCAASVTCLVFAYIVMSRWYDMRSGFCP